MGQWIGYPNMILVFECQIPQRNQMNFQTDISNNKYETKCVKRIIHPGQVNRLISWPLLPDIVASVSDDPKVYIWNTATQPSRIDKRNQNLSTPDLTLIGHQETPHETAHYGIAFHPTSPFVISGCGDLKVCYWSLRDYASSLTAKTVRPHSLGIDQYLTTRIINQRMNSKAFSQLARAERAARRNDRSLFLNNYSHLFSSNSSVSSHLPSPLSNSNSNSNSN